MNSVISIIDIPKEKCVPTLHNMSFSMGYENDVPASVASGLEKIMPFLGDLIEPKCGFLPVPIVSSDETFLDLGTIQLIPDRVIGRALVGATHLAIFAGTIGSALETQADECMKNGDTLLGYLCDVAGSVAAEKIAEVVHARIKESAIAENLSAGNRYSPGYCGWDVAEQKKLFSMLPDDFCGIHLAESAMMLPVKSVSGIVPIGFRLAHRPYACAVCTRNDCSRRNI